MKETEQRQRSGGRGRTVFLRHQLAKGGKRWCRWSRKPFLSFKEREKRFGLQIKQGVSRERKRE